MHGDQTAKENPLLDIRFGTLVKANEDPASYIRQIKQHGFESFSLFFWERVGDVNLEQLAREVGEAIGDADIKILCIGIYGNPLESRPIDAETLDGWRQCIDHAEPFGATVVSGFVGRLIDKPVPESLKQ